VQQPRLVASDVDGTLLGECPEPSPRTVRVVAAVLASGTPFVLVTGRPPRWIPPVAKWLPGVTTAVCANGAVRYDIAAKRVLSAATLSPEQLAGLDAAAARALPGSWLAVERVGIGPLSDPAAALLCEPGYPHAWPSVQFGTVPRRLLSELPAVKLLVRMPGMTSDQIRARLAPYVPPGVALTFANPNGLVEASPDWVTKATGLAEVAAAEGVARQDVIAFGDMPNDVDMLRWAGHGVAVGNAHPDVLAVADEVTAPNTEDGLALVLERWFCDRL
jgi:hydroxymethylpyrimidine pyrophosphatase-like HAD family hydrolase